MTFLPFIIRRAARHWQVLTTLSLGVILATALLASGPALIDSVIELGLQRKLETAQPQDGHLRLTMHTQADKARYEALDAQMQATLQTRLGDHLKRVVRSRGSNWMFPWMANRLVTDQRVNLCVYQEIADHIEAIAGDLPARASGDPRVIPAAIPDELAQLYALRVGDRLPLSFKRKDTAPGAWIEVTGIVRPRNPRDPYWFGEFSPLTSQSTSRWRAQYSAIIPPEVFFAATATLFPEAGMQAVWHVLLSHDTITADDIPSLRAQIAGLIQDLRGFESRVVLQSGLDDILADFQAQAETIRAPLYMLIAEVVLLALYYVTMVASLSVQSVEREFAVLRSRGASGWQITKLQLIEGILIAAVAFVSGPLLGALLVQGLSWVGPLADVGQGDWALSLKQGAWLAAGVGTAACLTGLLLPVGPALRRSIVTHQQLATRSSRPPWWQRFYLDVFVLLAGLILLWRLHLYGELVTGSEGRARLDWLLLLSPLALLLGSATILLRLYPPLLRGMAAIAARARGLSGLLAMWQASRNPTHVARLVLLLTLSIALGILSTGLNATLDQSDTERAHYLAGIDVRLLAKRSIPLADLRTAPGVRKLTSTWRGEGTVDLKSSRAYPRFEALALEPYSFSELTKYRDDFAERYMGELLGYLVADERQLPPMLPLPGRPARLGIWVRARIKDEQYGSSRQYLDGDSDVDRIALEAKLRTAQGELVTVNLRPPMPDTEIDPPINLFGIRMNIGQQETELRFRFTPFDDGWRYFDTSLPVLPPDSYPLSLYALWVQNSARRFSTPVTRIDMHLSVDDLTTLDSETGEVLLAEGFEEPTRIWFLDNPNSVARFTRSQPHTGEAVLDLDLNFSGDFKSTSLKLAEGKKRDQLPALVSPAFLEAAELQVGDSVRTWINSVETYFKIAGVVQYFPTLYGEAQAGFLITSRDLLMPLLNESSRSSINLNQVFIQTDGPASSDSLANLVPNLSQSWEAETLRKTFKADPLALGLRGVTFFGYTLTTLLSLIGFATHFYISALQRETLYGVMRAIGLSPRQLYSSMVVEQVVLILTGLALGTVLGVLLNQITLPRLPIALADRPPIPPFYPREDWLAVGRIYLTLAVAFLIALGVATVMLWHARVHRILRIGQE